MAASDSDLAGSRLIFGVLEAITPILGLRNYTQHYRPLPLKPRFETEERTECQTVVVELDELDYAGHWNMSKQRHFFADGPSVDENEMNLVPIILEFEELVDDLADWTRDNSFGMGGTEPTKSTDG